MTLRHTLGALVPAAVLVGAVATPAAAIDLNFAGRYTTGLGEASAEITAYDSVSKSLFVINTDDNSFDIVNIGNPNAPALTKRVSLASYGAGPNSIAFKNGLLAVAVDSDPISNPGNVAFFSSTGDFLKAVNVGALPDMITFTPDGQRLVVANEGEPDEDTGIDPEGSVSIIDLSGGIANLTQAAVKTATFTSFNGQEAALRAQGVRIFPGKTVAQDVEPEYIAISDDSKTAYVALQENNALAKLDLVTGEFTALVGLGYKDHSLPGNELDASDRDGGVNIRNWPVRGLYMPDAIATFTANGETYIISANEGDARDEDKRIGTLTLDPTAFPNAAALKNNAALGRLNASSIDGDTDGDGDYDQLYVYGSRSFSIWDSQGKLVYDSGSEFEKILASQFPGNFIDSRSDDKGPEPEGVTVATIQGQIYAFIGLERSNGVMVYNITDPKAPKFERFTPNPAGDTSPEGLLLIPQTDSPDGQYPYLVVSNEITGTVGVYKTVVPEPTTLLGLLSVGSLMTLGFKRKR
jgi:DNA-binding beta-propeller fold protein YncE